LFFYHFVMKVVFATNNSDKLKEIRNTLYSIVPGEYELVSMSDMGITEELPETKDTLEGNAIQKAKYISDKYSVVCFADDTGLEVYALNNRPGVYSARYAGEGCSYNDNIDKLLEELKGIDNRCARFHTVIALIYMGKTFIFEGSVDGTITCSKRGTNGFGYDPVFQPEGLQQTFAEMGLETKNATSQRAKAVQKLIEFLSNRNRMENILP
jgi:XTP/dITP diphosphohydrolase